MAELHVQPKNSRPWWLWLLLALAAVGLLLFLMRGCDHKDDTATTTTETTTTTDTTTTTTTTTTTSDDDWKSLNYDLPAANYEEITDKNIEVIGSEEYTIYRLDETVMFDTDQSVIKPAAAEKLKQVAASLTKRFNGGRVRVFGFTDAVGSATYNKELAEKRAEAVKAWLAQNGNVNADLISVHPVGEARPIASNATAAGKAQNRRVEIVARRAQ